MQPDQLTAQLLAGLLGVGPSASSSSGSRSTAAGGRTVRTTAGTVHDEIRLERELQERKAGRSDSDR